MDNANVMVDGFGRKVDEDLYWRNTGLSSASIARIKEYHRTHPVQADGTRLKDEDSIDEQSKRKDTLQDI